MGLITSLNMYLIEYVFWNNWTTVFMNMKLNTNQAYSCKHTHAHKHPHTQRYIPTHTRDKSPSASVRPPQKNTISKLMLQFGGILRRWDGIFMAGIFVSGILCLVVPVTYAYLFCFYSVAWRISRRPPVRDTSRTLFWHKNLIWLHILKWSELK